MKKYTTTDINRMLLSISTFKVLEGREYNGMHVPIQLRCTKCNNVIKKTVNNVIHRHDRCKCQQSKQIQPINSTVNDVVGALRADISRLEYTILQAIDARITQLTDLIKSHNPAIKQDTPAPITANNTSINKLVNREIVSAINKTIARYCRLYYNTEYNSRIPADIWGKASHKVAEMIIEVFKKDYDTDYGQDYLDYMRDNPTAQGQVVISDIWDYHYYKQLRETIAKVSVIL